MGAGASVVVETVTATDNQATTGDGGAIFGKVIMWDSGNSVGELGASYVLDSMERLLGWTAGD